jgi:hypothetical protein
MLLVRLGRPLAWKLVLNCCDLRLASTLSGWNLRRVAASSMSHIMGLITLLLHGLHAQVDTLLFRVYLIVVDD